MVFHTEMLKNLLFTVVPCFLVLFGYAETRDGFVKVSDAKELQRLVKLRTNVLAIVTKSSADISREFYSILEEVDREMKGIADIITIDCSDAKKLCKKFKFEPSKMEVKHFFNGKYHKEYDRALRAKSLITFLKNPQEEAPWSEDVGTKDIVHIEEAKDLMTVFKKETKRPVFLMFYTPWCQHCKQLKPEFASAATMLKKDFVFVGIDCQKAENYPLQQGFNVSGYPTLLLMKGGDLSGRYAGEYTRADLIDWLQHPEKQSINPEPKSAPPEEPWAEHVDMLTADSFDSYLSANPSVLVMFYAPWCGHCKRLKPEYEDAAKSLLTEKSDGAPPRLAAVDATKEPVLARRFKIQGYPTLKYFSSGEYKWDVHLRSGEEIIKFMLDPQEPAAPAEQNDGWEHDPEVIGGDGKSVVDFLDDDTFHSTLKKKKHSIVMFYAPWCGHCKAAKPQFVSAAKLFSGNQKVSFAAVDCTRSRTVCEEHEVRGFPTIVYFSYGKSPIPYEGQRDSDAFAKFMNSQIDMKSEL